MLCVWYDCLTVLNSPDRQSSCPNLNAKSTIVLSSVFWSLDDWYYAYRFDIRSKRRIESSQKISSTDRLCVIIATIWQPQISTPHLNQRVLNVFIWTNEQPTCFSYADQMMEMFECQLTRCSYCSKVQSSIQCFMGTCVKTATFQYHRLLLHSKIFWNSFISTMSNSQWIPSERWWIFWNNIKWQVAWQFAKISSNKIWRNQIFYSYLNWLRCMTCWIWNNTAKSALQIW